MTIEDRDVLCLTARAIAAWADGHRDLLGGVVALRTLGAEAEQAVEAVLAVREIRILKFSLELFGSLTRDAGVDPMVLLQAASSTVLVRSIDEALFGRRSLFWAVQ